MLLVLGKTGQTMTSDDLLRRFAKIRRRRDLLRRERAGCHCQRRDGNEVYPTQDGPCWKALRFFDEEYEMWKFPTETWCGTCRKRQQVHEQLRMVTQQHGAALRGLLRRGYALLGVPQDGTRKLQRIAREQ